MFNRFSTKKAPAMGTGRAAIVQEIDAGYDKAFIAGRVSWVSVGLRTLNS